MCSKTLAKCFLVVLDLIFALSGGILLVIGILVKVAPENLLEKASFIPMVDSIKNIAEENVGVDDSIVFLVEQCAYVLIAVGGVIFLIGFLGCCGACKESKCMLYLYCAFVGLLIVVQLAGAIYIFLKKDEVEEDIKQLLSNTLHDDYTGMGISCEGAGDCKLVPSDGPLSLGWDTIQISLKCCGCNNHTDYETATQWKDSFPASVGAPKIPVSCCKKMKVDHIKDPSEADSKKIIQCVTNPTKENAHLDQGCYDDVMSLLETYRYVVAGIALGVVAFEILCIICACTILRHDSKTKPM